MKETYLCNLIGHMVELVESFNFVSEVVRNSFSQSGFLFGDLVGFGLDTDLGHLSHAVVKFGEQMLKVVAVLALYVLRFLEVLDSTDQANRVKTPHHQQFRFDITANRALWESGFGLLLFFDDPYLAVVEVSAAVFLII